MCFVFLSALMILNMLVGILCEVVSSRAAVEKEEAAVNYLSHAMLEFLECTDVDGNEQIDQKEFCSLIAQPEVREMLQDFGVDYKGLLSISEVIFEELQQEEAASIAAGTPMGGKRRQSNRPSVLASGGRLPCSLEKSRSGLSVGSVVRPARSGLLSFGGILPTTGWPAVAGRDPSR